MKKTRIDGHLASDAWAINAWNRSLASLRRGSALALTFTLLSSLLLSMLFVSTVHAAGWGTAVLIESDNKGHARFPQVAVDPGGNATTVWFQSDGIRDNIWTNRYTSGVGWGTAELIESSNKGDARFPQVAVDPSGNATAVWYQSDGIRENIWANRRVVGMGWGTAVLIETNDTGDARFPQVAVDQSGNAVAVWHQSDIRTNIWANRYVVGMGWGTAELIETKVGAAVNPQVAIDAGSNAVAVWRQADAMRDNIWANRYTSGVGWGTAELIESNDTGSAWRPQVAIDPSGNAMAVWYQFDGIRLNAWANRYTSGVGWGTAEVIQSSIAGHPENPQVAVDPSGNAVAVWHEDDGPREITYANRYVVGLGWGTAELIETNAKSAWNPQVAVDVRGNAVVVGVQYDDAGVNIWANRYVVGLGWGTAELIETDDAGFTHHPQVAVDVSGNAVAVWDQSDGTRDNIWANRYTIPEGPPKRPDYAPKTPQPLPPIKVGVSSSLRLSIQVLNQGNNTAAENAKVAFYEDNPPATPFATFTLAPLPPAMMSSSFTATWISPATPGTYFVSVDVDYDDNVSEWDETNNVYTWTIDNVLVPDQIPDPPILDIEADEDDVLLFWTTPGPNISHYLIYRAMDQREFNFTDPLYNTSTDVSPLRTNWTDAGAANATSPKEYYYVVRAVDELGLKSITSNTAGKWTKKFPSGLSSFSLPLEPLTTHNVSWYANNMPNVTHIRWMDSSGHWVTHDKGMGEGNNDIPVVLGRGYEISLTSSTTYTFTGYPASMIRYREGYGDSTSFRKSLSAHADGSNVVLNWDLRTGASEYRIFRSEVRNGLHNLSLQPMASVPSSQNTWVDSDVLSSAGEYYYMVIPVDSQGRLGSSTYSVGVVTMQYRAGSDTFALPLGAEVHSLDWYCDQISNVVGIAHMMKGYWKLHAREMPENVYDADALQGEGYQISVDGATTTHTFVGY